MMVTVKIAEAANSPTQKVWGAVIPSITEPANDAAIFYGPSTKFGGGSVYMKPCDIALKKWHEKIRGEYAEIYYENIETDVRLDEVAEKILRGIQGNRYIPGVVGSLKTKPVDPISDPVQPKKPVPDISASIRSIPSGCDWSF